MDVRSRKVTTWLGQHTLRYVGVIRFVLQLLPIRLTTKTCDAKQIYNEASTKGGAWASKVSIPNMMYICTFAYQLNVVSDDCWILNFS